MVAFTKTVKGINGKIIFDDISEYVEDVIVDFGVIWENIIHRESLVEVIEDFLYERQEEGKITQFDVVCDDRNNTKYEMNNGMFHLLIKYKQRHCRNVSQIFYSIDAKIDIDIS